MEWIDLLLQCIMGLPSPRRTQTMPYNLAERSHAAHLLVKSSWTTPTHDTRWVLESGQRMLHCCLNLESHKDLYFLTLPPAVK